MKGNTPNSGNIFYYNQFKSDVHEAEVKLKTIHTLLSSEYDCWLTDTTNILLKIYSCMVCS